MSNDPYVTCQSCVVKDWCGRRNGSVSLPPDYPLNSECNGFIMLEQALKLARVPREYRNANKANYELPSDPTKDEKSAKLKRFLDNPVGMVKSGVNLALLHPNKGTGKTYTACSILNEFIYKGCMDPELFDFENPMALYIKFGTWANRNRDRYRDDAMYDETIRDMEQMREVPLLVLDDIGSGRITPVIRDLIYDVIDYRKEETKSTIYTSNFVDSVLKQDDYLGEIIVSRMMYKSAVIDMGGRDRRADIKF
ncbi:ATP-binding protein (plasmid) [Paenibacillus peoriae]|uniref:ATP-binding protein n=1 Tax=Paenibacillus peoriae TaxID=59893 RepID=A0A7H0YHD8_9BACL|nr:ATP-binding protein [Paenibacillus peoriae]QNR70496.1 ATP-binding protein [Paenibacillus peoriae]